MIPKVVAWSFIKEVISPLKASLTSLLLMTLITPAAVFATASDQASSADTFWDFDNLQRWYGEELEGAVDYCAQSSIRWDVPFINFDVNNDGRSDLLLTISCYQDLVPVDAKHNVEVKTAWKMFCSTERDSHEDCTERLFGTPVIDVTGNEGGGGSPYTHVAENPRDLNGDGYPEFWYALNRDDGRQGFDFNSEEDYRLLERFCGAGVEVDCTRQSVQTMLISNDDGTYEVKELPWGPQNTQAMLILPNALGSFDVWAMIYGPHRVARYVNGDFIDVTDEYASFDSWQSVTYGNPYAKAFIHDGKTYIARADIPPDIVATPTNISSTGFTLWLFEPGLGFSLSDFYTPGDRDLFEYELAQGVNAVTRVGAYFGDLPVFEPRWHFFDFEQLSPDEEPLLIVRSESAAQIGNAFQAVPNKDIVYRYGDFSNSDVQSENTLWFLNGIESFYVRDGKLIKRGRSVFEGDAFIGLNYQRFIDLDGDGDKDLIGATGGQTLPVIYKNEGGTMIKRFLGDIWPRFFFDESLWRVEDWLAYEYSVILFPFYQPDKLDLVYWTRGWGWSKPSFLPESFVFEHADFVIARALRPFADLPSFSMAKEQELAQYCIDVRGWVTDGLQETCLVGAPEPPDTDGDGFIDFRDPDDDGDGVIDSLDAFPLDDLEYVDTDSDGIGDFADLDDDDDGYSDLYEVALGSDPLNPSDLPISWGLSPAIIQALQGR